MLGDSAASDISSCITLIPILTDVGTKMALKYWLALSTLFSKFPGKPSLLTTLCAWEGPNTSFPANPNPNTFTCDSVMQLMLYFVMVAAAFAAFHLDLRPLAAAPSTSSLTRRWQTPVYGFEDLSLTTFSPFSSRNAFFCLLMLYSHTSFLAMCVFAVLCQLSFLVANTTDPANGMLIQTFTREWQILVKNPHFLSRHRFCVQPKKPSAAIWAPAAPHKTDSAKNPRKGHSFLSFLTWKQCFTLIFFITFWNMLPISALWGLSCVDGFGSAQEVPARGGQKMNHLHISTRSFFLLRGIRKWNH